MTTKEMPVKVNGLTNIRVSVEGLHLSLKVSAMVITYNEEQNIRRTLAKLTWCDEIVVVDSYSTDSTVAICKEFGCKVFFKTFEGYGNQKQYALSKTNNNWVLCIDADEVLTDKLIEEIKEVLADGKEYAGYYLRMNMVFLNKEFLHGKESARYFLRLFNKQKGSFTDDKVHERICVNGPVKNLHQTFRHYSYTSLHQYLEKNNRYSTYSAEVAFSKGKSKSMLAVLFALPFNFFKYYVIELNCLNGTKGFYWAVLSSYYHFAKYIKLKEMHQNHAMQKSMANGQQAKH